MRHRRTVAALSLIVLTIAALSFARIHRPTQPAAQPAPVPHLTYHGPATFWDYQCIDTMKTSRDRTREWAHRPDLPQLIDEQVSLVAATGANCIAIGTPYDPEFMPVLQTWVASARTHHLRVWFRGNFCGWEGWFGYPRTLTTAQLLNQTDQFIAANPGLFSDGDQFTAAPEAENGGPFKPAGAHFITDYRAFLTAQTDRTAGAFARIGKHVGTNWASMSGGVARSILDRTTIDNLGGLVTLDHYVPAATAMTNEVDYYHDHFGAHVVVGEWGAPIPDINGPLTSDQQTNLVTQILAGLATRHNYVDGVSYWTLTGGTTGLTDDNGAVRPVYAALKRYYRPTILSGTVRDTRGHAIADATITLDGALTTTTDRFGRYIMLSPSGSTSITVSAPGYIPNSTQPNLDANPTASFSAILTQMAR